MNNSLTAHKVRAQLSNFLGIFPVPSVLTGEYHLCYIMRVQEI